jgi:hypothetical protein
MDSQNLLSTFDDLIPKLGNMSEEENKLYIVSAHGAKSALSNIRESELSNIALKLEIAGKDKNVAIIVAETPAFVAALRSLVDSLEKKS